MRSSKKLPIGVAIMLTMMFAGMYEGSALNSGALAAGSKQEEAVGQETEQIETEIEGSAKQDAKKTEEVLQNSTISKISDETTIAQASSETNELQDKIGQEDEKRSDSRAGAIPGETLSADTETKETETKEVETFINEEKAEPENQTSKTKTLAKGNAKSVEETPGEMLRKDDYNVEFTYDNLQYVLKGGTSVELREILSTVGLSGTPTNAVSSNDDLFTTDKVFGEWVVKSKKAFNTKETLSVTISDTVYDITVTDEQSGQCGENVTYTLSDAGVLTITGTGAMNDYDSAGNVPWYGQRNSIKEIVIGSGVTTIGERVFRDEPNLTSVTLPSTLERIGQYAFMNCSSLESIDIPEGVTKIGNCAFRNAGLTEITIPSTVTTTSNFNILWFDGCQSLEKVTWLTSATVGPLAFQGCTSLREVNFAGSLGSIGYNAFTGCSSLESITIPEGAEYIGQNAFSDCTSLSSVDMPSTLTHINSWAFSGCSSLESVTIPEGVDTIEEKTFSGCEKLSRIDIPSTVTSINDNAFKGLYSNVDVYYNGTSTAFRAIDSNYDSDDSTIFVRGGDNNTQYSFHFLQDVHFGGGVENDALTKTYGDSPFTTALEDIVEGTATYSSSDPTVASIDSSTGEVTIYRASDTPITITATIPATEHYIETTKSYALTVNKAGNPAYADPYEVNVIWGGNTADLSQNLKSVPVGSAITYSIADNPAPPEGCSIDENTGEFTSGSELGDAYVVVDIGETTNYESTTVNMLVHVVEKARVDLDVSQTSITYGGVLNPPSYIKPPQTETETVIYEGTLRNGAAYGPTSEKPTEAGSYSVQVTCETSDKIYSGQADFNIFPKNISGATVTLLGHLVYNGQEQTQAVQSIILDGNNITELCVISGNTVQNAGDYLLTAKIADETGNYTGSVTKGFTVDKVQTEVGKVYADDLKNTLDPSDVVFHREDETVPGTFSLVEDRLLYGTHTYHWIFTPDDTINYETATGVIEITVINTKPDPKPKPEPIPTPKPEPEPEPEKVENQIQSSKSVKTGDGSNLSLWGALLASTPLGYYISKRRKKK